MSKEGGQISSCLHFSNYVPKCTASTTCSTTCKLKYTLKYGLKVSGMKCMPHFCFRTKNYYRQVCARKDRNTAHRGIPLSSCIKMTTAHQRHPCWQANVADKSCKVSVEALAFYPFGQLWCTSVELHLQTEAIAFRARSSPWRLALRDHCYQRPPYMDNMHHGSQLMEAFKH